jgi:hypothetical protein
VAFFWVDRENFESKEQSAELNLTLNNGFARAPGGGSSARLLSPMKISPL